MSLFHFGKRELFLLMSVIKFSLQINLNEKPSGSGGIYVNICKYGPNSVLDTWLLEEAV